MTRKKIVQFLFIWFIHTTHVPGFIVYASIFTPQRHSFLLLSLKLPRPCFADRQMTNTQQIQFSRLSVIVSLPTHVFSFHLFLKNIRLKSNWSLRLCRCIFQSRYKKGINLKAAAPRRCDCIHVSEATFYCLMKQTNHKSLEAEDYSAVTTLSTRKQRWLLVRTIYREITQEPVKYVHWSEDDMKKKDELYLMNGVTLEKFFLKLDVFS